jgi:hypothetical protein
MKFLFGKFDYVLRGITRFFSTLNQTPGTARLHGTSHRSARNRQREFIFISRFW